MRFTNFLYSEHCPVHKRRSELQMTGRITDVRSLRGGGTPVGPDCPDKIAEPASSYCP